MTALDLRPLSLGELLDRTFFFTGGISFYSLASPRFLIPSCFSSIWETSIFRGGAWHRHFLPL